MPFLKTLNKTRPAIFACVAHVATSVATTACLLGFLLAGCGGGGGGSSTGGNPLAGGNGNVDPGQSTCTTPPAATGTVTIKGTVTYDRVPTLSNHLGVELNYDAITAKPARGVVVQALACNLSLISSTVTDDTGQYSLQVGGKVPVMIRVKAQLLSTSGAKWNVNVANNTSNDAQYVLDGAIVETTTTNETRNLHAASGWGGTRYSDTRAAAPFAILDSIYTGMKKVAAVDAAVNFPQLTVHWSTANQQSDTEDDVGGGKLPASYYDFRTGGIYLLGKENQDTDEYDDHVILHEWGHYVEHRFGRSDNLGGAHSDASYLDARVAQSEGFGNAWSAITSDDPLYVDTGSTRQSSGFDFNVESDIVDHPGWFREFSVQQIIYDLYDAATVTATGTVADDDDLALGLGPIWQTITTVLPSTPAFVTIFSFIDGLKHIVPAQASLIDDITSGHNIKPIVDAYGSTEDNWAGLTFPSVEGTANVYETLALNSPQSVCTFGDYGAYNGLGIYRYLRFNAATNHNYLFSVASSNNSTGTPKPVISIWKNGTLVKIDLATIPVSQTLSAGDYIVEVFDDRNTDGDPLDETGNTVATIFDVCFSVTATAP